MATLLDDRILKKPRVLKRVNPVNIGSESFEEGDYCFRISNFDDYIYFALTEYDNGIETPMDLTTFGDIFLKFVSRGNSIEIPSVPNLQNIESAKGEVVFKIDKASSEAIVQFPSSSFSIVSKLVKGTDYSFESVLFEGLFLKPNSGEKISARFNQIYNQQTDQTLQSLKTSYDEVKQIVQQLETYQQELTEIYAKEQTKEKSLNAQFTALNNTLKSNDQLQVNIVPTTQPDTSTSGDVSDTGLENLGDPVNLPRGSYGGRPAPVSNTDSDTILRARNDSAGGVTTGP